MSRQAAIDQENTEFWDTLCGWNLAQRAGITGRGEDDLRRFDELYLGFYPYLERYVPDDLTGKKVLEIGLGYGTLSQLLASRGADLSAADIAPGPVAIVRRRLEWLGKASDDVRQASALELPWADGTFDFVYSIGCLHHTGNLPRSVDEVHRVLKPGGRAVVMLYNRNSLRRITISLRNRLRGMSRRESEDSFRAMYDAHDDGDAAPHTDFVSRAEVRELFRKFGRVRIEPQNFDGYRFGIKREWFLNNLARVAGLDLYITADKV